MLYYVSIGFIYLLEYETTELSFVCTIPTDNSFGVQKSF